MSRLSKFFTRFENTLQALCLILYFAVFSVKSPTFGKFCLFASGQLLAAASQASVADPGWKKIQILDLDPHSAINNLDHISKSLVTVVWIINS